MILSSYSALLILSPSLHVAHTHTQTFSLPPSLFISTLSFSHFAKFVFFYFLFSVSVPFCLLVPFFFLSMFCAVSQDNLSLTIFHVYLLFFLVSCLPSSHARTCVTLCYTHIPTQSPSQFSTAITQINTGKNIYIYLRTQTCWGTKNEKPCMYLTNSLPPWSQSM